ncbi:hypothetical protein OK074_5358 [Actinobacteria bacterium OK074]|nr:hypothetical protein OK074_5358 [Actinobacteria bacterium OK074]
MMYDQSRAQLPPDQSAARAQRRTSGPEPLLPAAERDEVVDRLRQAINTFADTPKEALEEAERAFDEATAHLANALAEQRRALRDGWQDRDPETHPDELRVALRQYRELTQRLLRA